MRFRVLASSLAMLLHVLPSSAAEPTVVSPTAATDSLSERLDRAMALAGADDVAQATVALAGVIGDPAFPALPDDKRNAAYLDAAWMAIRSGDLPRARDLYRSATGIDPDAPDAWYHLSLIEHDLGNHEPAAEHLLTLLSVRPDTLENLSEQHISVLIHKLDHSSPLRLALLHRLFDLQWSRKGLGADSLWYELALLHVERGELEAAKVAIDSVHTPVEVIKMRADRRFDGLVDPGSPRFDVLRIANAHADNLRVKAMLDPERLDVLMELTYALLVLDRADEVLTMTDAALALIEASGPEGTMFESMADRVWLMNNRAIALRRMQRTDEALEQMLVASTLEEDGQPNVSQALNLGNFYCGLGRADDALDAIAPAGAMSGYGRMVQTAVKHCAARLKGDEEAADRALAYLREHRGDSQAIYVAALLEAGRTDEAAAVVIELLNAADTRAEALFRAQEFLHPEPLPADGTRIERQRALYRRQDVRAVIDRVGRVEQQPIHADTDLR